MTNWDSPLITPCAQANHAHKRGQATTDIPVSRQGAFSVSRRTSPGHSRVFFRVFPLLSDFGLRLGFVYRIVPPQMVWCRVSGFWFVQATVSLDLRV